MARFQRPRTVAEGVYQHLRRRLLAGELEPGRWLREQELAASLDVSRTPVREAVRQLAQEGLLVIEANRGVRVRGLTLEEAVATYEVRERLESMAAGLAARRVDAAARAALDEQLAAMNAVDPADQAEHVRADDAFHGLVARLSGNPVLQELVERLSERVMRVKVLTRDVNVSAFAREQHARIVAAIGAGDEAAAEAAMREHIRTNLRIVEERLAGAGPGAGGEEA
ncbi:MAG: GntR family transcriptional regulator [Deinococcales bacterium]|nr:GntR family transcriptional regulator [Deinococcales bacterium]